MPKDTKTLGNSKARACESLGFVHKKGCARVLTQPLFVYNHFSNGSILLVMLREHSLLPNILQSVLRSVRHLS